MLLAALHLPPPPLINMVRKMYLGCHMILLCLIILCGPVVRYTAVSKVNRQNLAPQEGWHKKCPPGNWLVFNSYCNELKTSQNVLLHQPHQNSWQSDFDLLNSAYWPYKQADFTSGLYPSRADSDWDPPKIDLVSKMTLHLRTLQTGCTYILRGLLIDHRKDG